MTPEASPSKRLDPQALLDSALAAAGAGRLQEAGMALRAALALRPGYTFHARAAALVSQIWQAHPPALRQARVAILGASTTSLIVPVLRALCFRDGIAAEFYEGMYGGYRQEVLDVGSRLYGFAPSIVFIMPHWRDLSLPPVSASEDETVERVVTEFEVLWAQLRERTGCHVVQHGFDFPAQESHDYAASVAAGGRTRLIGRINAEIARRAPASVSILDAASVQREVGDVSWQDQRLWHVARQHPAPAALPALAELQAAHLRAAAGLTRKVVVCDLDNTLWGGIIGEDGVNGIRVGPGSPAGEAHADLQEYLLELKARGILLAVCSKNNPDEARLAFERHPRMRLRLDDFAAFVANWDDKARNIRAIAAQLSLGTDSFVLLDDNPAERAWVRGQLPEVAVVELESPFSYVRDLDAGRYFFSFSITDEDRRRAELYRGESARHALRARFDSLDDFLADLQMSGACLPIGPETIGRVTQLVNKTNQFNLTGRRRQSAEIASLLAQPGAWGAVFSLADRFGDHGLIAVVLCACPEPATWEIDTWVMSCRVLGRGMERFVAEHVLAAARAASVRRIVGIFRPTGRNIQVEPLYPQLGFSPTDPNGEEMRYVCLVDEARLPAHGIADTSDLGQLTTDA